ncbi:MAG: hypothetical protein KC464_24315 [Myxococcales bacterium]|nr:hypothetical protein [Myxococcales bacterium]
MATNAIFFGWASSIPGREAMSAEHFGQFTQFLTGMKAAGMITGFDPVFLNPHGGDLGGFFLIHGEAGALHALTESDAWIEHVTRASLHLNGLGVVQARTGAEVGKQMQVWTKHLPRS